MAAKAQCMKTGVHVGPIAAGITPAWQGRSRPPRPNDPAAWGYAARSPKAGKIWRTTPALASRYVRHNTPFQRANCPANSSRRVEPFLFRPDKTLPGTLHHSGNRPAPPSDHTPLARRSAFSGAKRGNSDAPAGLERMQREDFCRLTRGKNPFVTRWNMELCGSAPVIAEERGRFP
jgi:hypothetical protein